MGHVTEREILSTLKAQFRQAAECCEKLATYPARGPVYDQLRKHLLLAEGCCRQIAWYRGDTRWLPIGLKLEEAHRRAGNWLRTMPRTETENAAHPLFLKLAEILRGGQKMAQDLETKATGIAGLILPEPGMVLPVMPPVQKGAVIH